MNPRTNYTERDREGIAKLVGAIVGHPVDCADVDESIVGGRIGSKVYQIMPAQEVERKSPIEEFWWQSDYSNTQQFWESPIDAGLHYPQHYLKFVRENKVIPTDRSEKKS